MSFDIIFYKNRSEPNRLDKTSYLDRYARISGVLRNSTSIISPTIDIQFEWRQDYVVEGQGTWVISDGKKVILATLEELLQCNYCYIEAFKRYYYITNIVSVRNGLWSVSMSVDVLMSYKDIIKQQRGIVARNEFDFNNLLNDPLLPATEKPIFYTAIGQNMNENFLLVTESDANCCVISCVDLFVDSKKPNDDGDYVPPSGGDGAGGGGGGAR